eukprot:4912-Rhodomonas_salina.1
MAVSTWHCLPASSSHESAGVMLLVQSRRLGSLTRLGVLGRILRVLNAESEYWPGNGRIHPEVLARPSQG